MDQCSPTGRPEPAAGRARSVCLVAGAFVPDLWLLDLGLAAVAGPAGEAGAGGGGAGDAAAAAAASFVHPGAGAASGLSVFPAGAPPPGSALLAPPPPPPPPVAPAAGAGVRREGIEAVARASGVRRDQPVTFKTRIPSSGYGQPPTPPAGPGRAAAGKRSAGGGAAAAGRRGGAAAGGKDGGRGAAEAAAAAAEGYPMDCGPPLHRQAEADPAAPPQHAAAVRRLAFAPDGRRVATAGADGVAGVLRAPLRRHGAAGAYLTGHAGAVNTVAWGVCGGGGGGEDAPPLLLTSGADRTVRVWAPPGGGGGGGGGGGEAVLLIDRRTQAPAGAVGAVGAAPAPPASGDGLGDVTDARFFYMDRLIVVAAGRDLLAFTYRVPEATAAAGGGAAAAAALRRDDLARLRGKGPSGGRYRLAARLQSGAQGLTAMGCANGFLSHLVASALSRPTLS